MLYSSVEVYRRFGGRHCHHNQQNILFVIYMLNLFFDSDAGGSMFFRNFEKFLPDFPESYPVRTSNPSFNICLRPPPRPLNFLLHKRTWLHSFAVI
jgi:hypothetical protein